MFREGALKPSAAASAAADGWRLGSGPDTDGLKSLMDSEGLPTPCLPSPCPKNTLGVACNKEELKNCKAIPGAPAAAPPRFGAVAGSVTPEFSLKKQAFITRRGSTAPPRTSAPPTATARRRPRSRRRARPTRPPSPAPSPRPPARPSPASSARPAPTASPAPPTATAPPARSSRSRAPPTR